MYISVTRIAIILCWLSLFSFWALKIFGGNFFEIMVENENFLKFSNFVGNSWLRYLSSFITIFIAQFFIIGAICQRFYFKGKSSIFITICILSIWIVADFVNVDIIKMFYGYIVLIFIGAIYNKGKKRMLGILAIIFEFVFSTLCMITKNLQLSIIDDYLIYFIGSIDLYIMYSLYYLYSNLIRMRKGK